MVSRPAGRTSLHSRRVCNDRVPSPDMSNMGNATARVGAALFVAAAGLAATHATSSADPGAHQVRYTVTTTSALQAQIYDMATEPPSQSAFNADSSPYLINVRVPVSPEAPWVYETTLNDTTQWAIVSASGGLRVNPEFHCEIAVDGVVVVSEQGGSGVQCALRPW
jgi:hypothetical protein